ncbi:MAG: hypothetical protein ACOC2U_02785 [bacterium]
MASVITNYFKRELFAGGYNLSADTFNCALISDDISVCATDDIREMDNWTDISAMEISGTGYDAGGTELSGTSISVDTANNIVKFDADDVVWSNSSLSARGAAIYESGSNDLMGFIDFGSVKTTNNTAFKIQWHTNGIMIGS